MAIWGIMEIFTESLLSCYFSMFFSQDEDKGVTDGEWLGKHYFHCAPKRGLFVRLQSCQPDVRFQCLHNSELSLMVFTKFSGERGDGAVLGQGMLRRSLMHSVLISSLIFFTFFERSKRCQF